MSIEGTLSQVCQAFRIPGEIVEYRALTSGNINSTYYVMCQDGQEKKDYLVQCVNAYVFKNPERVMHNIELVTEHIKKKLEVLNDLGVAKFSMKDNKIFVNKN